jgi:hypothetical protein
LTEKGELMAVINEATLKMAGNFKGLVPLLHRIYAKFESELPGSNVSVKHAIDPETDNLMFVIEVDVVNGDYLKVDQKAVDTLDLFTADLMLGNYPPIAPSLKAGGFVEPTFEKSKSSVVLFLALAEENP